MDVECLTSRSAISGVLYMMLISRHHRMSSNAQAYNLMARLLLQLITSAVLEFIRCTSYPLHTGRIASMFRANFEHRKSILTLHIHRKAVAEVS